MKFHSVVAVSFWVVSAAIAGPMPSWKEGKAKTAILEFVNDAVRSGGPRYIPAEERIAVFDNDGTLWSEQPLYFQLFFTIDRVKALAEKHPEWKDKEPFASLLRGDIKAVLAQGEKGLLEVMAVTHTGMTTEEFSQTVADWIGTAKHPTSGRPYTEMIYQPMVELLDHLRSNGFKTYIVSGGGVEFMRPWVAKTYGIPPEQVIGSYGKLKWENSNDKPVLIKLSEVGLVDDHAGKPVGIQTFIGRRPVAAFGNSDGDLEMLEWTMAGKGPRFAALVHHDDAKREWSYDRTSLIGKLDKAWDQAKAKGWTVVSIKDDWAVVHPPEQSIRTK